MLPTNPTVKGNLCDIRKTNFRKCSTNVVLEMRFSFEHQNHNISHQIKLNPENKVHQDSVSDLVNCWN
jgi:hypothetical protein